MKHPILSCIFMLLLAAGLAVTMSGCSHTGEKTAARVDPAVTSSWNLRGPGPHLVAHYMSWFEVQESTAQERNWRHWKWDATGPVHDPEEIRTNGLRSLSAASYPLIGPYNSWSRNVIRYHLKSARAAGVEAFIVDWYGPGSYEDRQVPLLLEEAAKVGMRIALCYEEKLNFEPYRHAADQQQVVESTIRDFQYIVENYGQHPAYLKRNDTPFVAIFGCNASRESSLSPLSADEWNEVFNHLTTGVVCAHQNLDSRFHPAMQSAYTWWTPDLKWLQHFSEEAGALKRQGKLDFFMTMVCPGFNNRGVWGWGKGPTTTTSEDLSIFKNTFDAAVSGDPDLVQVVTWNDFEEGTAIEPSLEKGFAYLDALESWWCAARHVKPDLSDNRDAYVEYLDNCSEQERAQLPPATRTPGELLALQPPPVSPEHAPAFF